MFMKKLIDYIARQVWNEVGISLTEGITQKESLKVVYKILSELAGDELAEEFITNLLEAEEEKKSDVPEEGEGGEEKEFDDKEQVAMMTQAERDAITEKIDDKLLKTKLTNPTTGNKNQVSTLLGKKKSDRPAYNVAAKFLKKQGVSDEDIEGQSNTQQGDSEPQVEDAIDRSRFDKKEKDHRDNPNGPTRNQILDDLNSGNLDVLDEYQSGVSSNREKGIAGAGGAVASEGESKYCSAVDADFEKFNSENKDEIDEMTSKFADKKKSSDERRLARQLGMDPESPEFNNYLAQREVWSNQQLEKLKSDKDSVFYKNFKGDDKKYKDWMYVAYDGGRNTQRAIKSSSIDESKPYKTVQSTSEVDQAVQAHLEDAVKNAKSPEDKKHAETQLKNFKKFKGYHDTYVVGKDEQGRTTYMGISNKKDDQIKDPQANSTPAARMESMKSKYGQDVADSVSKSMESNIQRVSDVRGESTKRASTVEVTDELVKICETDEMKPYMDTLRGRKDMAKYLREKGIDITKLSNRELLIEMNNKAQEMIADGQTPPYIPYGKIATKVGEFASDSKFRRENSDINYEDDALQSMVDIKNSEKTVVKDSHTSLVSDLTSADEPDGYHPTKNPDADNGKHQQGYISGVLDACHIDSYIDMDSDDGMLLQMGVNSVKPSMIRECVAERSGFKGDSSTPEGRKALKDHLRKRCRVTPGEASVRIMDNGQEVELFEDTWRTAGQTQKVATKFGGAMRECLQGKAAR